MAHPEFKRSWWVRHLKEGEFMRTNNTKPKFLILVSGLLLLSCYLPGMIPLNREPAAPMPVMEKDAEKVIAALNANNYVRLEALAQERYTEDMFKPGTRTFTVKITDEKPTYFDYGWCTTTEEILRQNFEHIKVNLYINGDEIQNDFIHPLTFTRIDGLVCLAHGVLMSDWPAGEYKLEAIATFDEKINDGLADYEAGDYAFEYNVTVEASQTATETPAASP
jgi:hypothetical protein